ncbi:hypothetical protein M885DRAFT_153275 [Pelagophyceae sp. CCMP2097]|nr:hypothetical protein M885DRAFT_153275 [Pelagophyceae sp. CCMP2097]
MGSSLPNMGSWGPIWGPIWVAARAMGLWGPAYPIWGMGSDRGPRRTAVKRPPPHALPHPAPLVQDTRRYVNILPPRAARPVTGGPSAVGGGSAPPAGIAGGGARGRTRNPFQRCPHSGAPDCARACPTRMESSPGEWLMESPALLGSSVEHM